MDFNAILSNVYLWIILTFTFLIICIIQFILFILIKMKTHAMLELKAWMKKMPISIFTKDGKNIIFKATKVEAGIINDEKMGVFIPSDVSCYNDIQTRNLYYIFDADFAGGINVHAAKVADDIKFLAKDEETLYQIREGLLEGTLADKTMEKIKSITQSINLNNLKYMLFSLSPHAINSYIQMKIAEGLRGNKKVDWVGTALLFMAVLGAIVIGAILIKTMGK